MKYESVDYVSTHISAGLCLTCPQEYLSKDSSRYVKFGRGTHKKISAHIGPNMTRNAKQDMAFGMNIEGS